MVSNALHNQTHFEQVASVLRSFRKATLIDTGSNDHAGTLNLYKAASPSRMNFSALELLSATCARVNKDCGIAFDTEAHSLHLYTPESYPAPPVQAMQIELRKIEHAFQKALTRDKKGAYILRAIPELSMLDLQTYVGNILQAHVNNMQEQQQAVLQQEGVQDFSGGEAAAIEPPYWQCFFRLPLDIKLQTEDGRVFGGTVRESIYDGYCEAMQDEPLSAKQSDLAYIKMDAEAFGAVAAALGVERDRPPRSLMH